MSNFTYEQALVIAKGLSERSTDELFQELGLRIRDIENLGGYERSQQLTADYTQVAEEMLSFGDLKVIGRRWWRKLEPELMNMVCEKNNQDIGQITGGKTIPQVAAGLATAAVVTTLAPPAWLIVATTILATKIVSTGLDALCETWQESLKKP